MDAAAAAAAKPQIAANAARLRSLHCERLSHSLESAADHCMLADKLQSLYLLGVGDSRSNSLRISIEPH